MLSNKHVQNIIIIIVKDIHKRSLVSLSRMQSDCMSSVFCLLLFVRQLFSCSMVAQYARRVGGVTHIFAKQQKKASKISNSY